MKTRQIDDRVRVRWKQGSHGWRYGRLPKSLGLVGPDGSLRVHDEYSGAMRSLPPEVLQFEGRGPRGGKRWEWMVTPYGGATRKPRPAWNPPEGPAELFNQAGLFEVLGGAA